MRIVIAGGSGFIGTSLVRLLSGMGHKTTTLSRRPLVLPEGAASLLWDPASPGEWTRAVREADAVVNLCGESVAEGRWTEERKRALLASRILPTRALAGALAGSKGAVLINASAVGFYGSGLEPADESSSEGTGFLAGLCRDWEAEALKASGARVVLLRLGVVLGKGGGALGRMLPPFRLGLGGRLGSGRQHFPWIHQDDAAGLAAFCLFEPKLSGPMNATSPSPVTNAQFTRSLARVLHRPAFFPVPASALRLALGELSTMLLEGRPVLPKAAQAAGYAFRFTDLDSALADLLK